MRLLKSRWILGAVFLTSALTLNLYSQGLVAPLEIRQSEAKVNFQSYKGVPLSSTVSDPEGSDGRAPTLADQQLDNLTELPPTANQFQSFISHSAIVRPLAPANLVAGRNLGQNANNIQLPRTPQSGVSTAVLTSATVGASIIGQRIEFFFGSEIRPPETDEFGDLLAENSAPEDYWLPEPHTTDNHASADYYWSPHARKVFAVKSGPVTVTWKKSQPSSDEPVDVDGFSLEGGNYYSLFESRFYVSGSATKTPKRMYWTEGAFQNVGKPIDVPEARVGAVVFVYNSNFPERVEEEYKAPGQSDVIIDNGLQETRTIWYDHTRGQILAHNKEGRVFMEILGDPTTDGSAREHLGFEVVDVRQQANPFNVYIDLGERLTAYQDARDDNHLTPEPLNQLGGQAFIFQNNREGSEDLELYAARKTINLNDALVYWLEEGQEGLLWPARLVRYDLDWPVDPGKYSHYIRPQVATELDAKTTAIPLPDNNVPFVQYQDPLDFPRAKITEETEFFTYLSPEYPAHRTLLRFSSADRVRFERVFSWLNSTLRSGEFSDTVANQLNIWDQATSTLDLSDQPNAPFVVHETVEVGRRIQPPDGEIGSSGGDSYLPGYVQLSEGDSISFNSYIDPIESGFDAAALGAIIPVNAIPGKNELEVWWFRENDADNDIGFETIRWPSALGRYTIQWPDNPREIIMASNDGSGALSSFEQRGDLYVQNDPSQRGYNPNEEHALIIGGVVYALRDDLNISSGSNYSSHPFALLEYTAGDDRPSMTVLKILREKPSEGMVFDYVLEAGSLVQAPMPLPFLPLPVEGSGDNSVNYNVETQVSGSDVPTNWDTTTDDDASAPFNHYDQFTYEDRKHSHWIYRGLHAGPPALEMGSFDPAIKTFGAFPSATAVAGQSFEWSAHVSRRTVSLTLEPVDPESLPDWLLVDGVGLSGTPTVDDVGAFEIELRLTDVGDSSEVTKTLMLSVVETGEIVTQSPLVLTAPHAFGDEDVTFKDRAPYLAEVSTGSNSFRMRFYYKTQDGFAWPGTINPPASGSIVPFLRPLGESGYEGNPASKNTLSQEVIYRPAWPALPPTLLLGDTLTTPKQGLPAVRGQTGLQILYQQSIAEDIDVANVSALLHDPTREKTVDIGDYGMDILPPSLNTDTFQGKVYFPNLPPHLVERFFYDPTRSETGELVFKGEFKEETLGSDYLMLNVLSRGDGGSDGSDLALIKALVPDTDSSNKSSWNSAIDALSTTLETFYENPNVPGQFIPNPTLDESVSIDSLAVISDVNTAVDSYALSASGPGIGYITLIAGDSEAFTDPGEPVSILVFRVDGPMENGEVKPIAPPNPLSELITLQHSLDLGGEFQDFEYEWMIAPPADGLAPEIDEVMSGWTLWEQGLDKPFITLGGGGIQGLVDNYITMRYRPKNSAHPLYDQWSDWTSPQLAEGWIKRVLAGINPFNQRLSDLFNNSVNTDVSLLTQAGTRWEGDVALNLENINDFGLIEIYETVLRRGKALSINAGINFGPANDALLLAAGYINDLYMMLGNEALADAANPTIGIGTSDEALGDIATSLFSFKGQLASLLEEELALLRGRDDTLLPGVELAPVYNRLVWNYTRGIDSGEVIYAVNYNIQEDPNRDPDGVINAEDAAVMFPMGHGDAYGHFLTALKGYFSLLLDPEFDWVPRIEAVSLLGQPVSVDYLDERKFAEAASSLANAGLQVFDLTWKKDYQANPKAGWEHFADTRVNDNRDPAVTRYWGMDHWSSRVGQGTYFNWIVGNSMIPEVDTDPTHEGIQKIDRSTVPELKELATIGAELQQSMDNAEGRLNPLGLPENSVPFDISPAAIAAGAESSAHFEQVYDRASQALQNAVVAFDDTKEVTRWMRSEELSLDEFRLLVSEEELAYETALIEIYGTPYADDIGPGRTYTTGYEGPDLVNYMYVDQPQLEFPGLLEVESSKSFKVNIQNFTTNFVDGLSSTFDFIDPIDQGVAGQDYITYEFSQSGYLKKPSTWTGSRSSSGQIQDSISKVNLARLQLLEALEATAGLNQQLDGAIQLLKSKIEIENEILNLDNRRKTLANQIESVSNANETLQNFMESTKSDLKEVANASAEAMPSVTIAGLAAGGDLTSFGRAGIKKVTIAIAKILEKTAIVRSALVGALSFRNGQIIRDIEYNLIPALEMKEEFQADAHEIAALLRDLQGSLFGINENLQLLDDAERRVQQLIARGDRVQREREIFRQRTSAIVQGYRTRDAAFRIFRNEKLERYKSLFDLAARYTYMAAKAYDYETGLLHTSQGQAFLNRIVNSRALGVVQNGEPQFAGSNTGDPGLSSVLAEMKGDWQVLRGRLGFNNPDEYGTTVSLRGERYRILPGTEGDTAWRDVLEAGIKADLLSDEDVRRYCMQIDNGAGLPVPGIVLEFSTTIADGRNLFGHALSPGDHAFSPTSFATKLFSLGVALEGYVGMDDPGANSSAVAFAGASSPASPSFNFMDPNGLSATPYIYLIPVGVDSMRSPPLGDTSVVRSWSIEDVTIPMPFNIGASDFSSKKLYQSSDSLTESLFGIRKHQAFRPVSDVQLLTRNLYGGFGGLTPSQFTNSRLIGRSVWNSKWKLIIPGRTLLSDPDDGLDRLVRTLNDIKLHLITYSYSGN